MIPDQPFQFCADDADADDAADDAYEIFEANDGIMDYPDAVSADDAPQDGETYISSWGELLYAMTNGEMGTQPPKTLRRYYPRPRTRETKPPHHAPEDES